MMEPFAVALQAVKRAGSVAGKRVLVTGGGPIGLLVLLTARAFGATPVALSDVVAGRRETALKLGADAVLDPAAKDLPERVGELTGDGFDVIFEASGAPPALRQAFDLVRPGGTIVQIGTLGTDDVPLPANQLMVRETQFIGSFRYGNVFGEAIRLGGDRPREPRTAGQRGFSAGRTPAGHATCVRQGRRHQSANPNQLDSPLPTKLNRTT